MTEKSPVLSSTKIQLHYKKPPETTKRYKTVKGQKPSVFNALRHFTKRYKTFKPELITRRSEVQILPPQPRRRKLPIACDDDFSFRTIAVSRSFRCSSSPNRTRCAGLRFGLPDGNCKFCIAVPTIKEADSQRIGLFFHANTVCGAGRWFRLPFSPKGMRKNHPYFGARFPLY